MQCSWLDRNNVVERFSNWVVKQVTYIRSTIATPIFIFEISRPVIVQIMSSSELNCQCSEQDASCSSGFFCFIVDFAWTAVVILRYVVAQSQ